MPDRRARIFVSHRDHSAHWWSDQRLSVRRSAVVATRTRPRTPPSGVASFPPGDAPAGREILDRTAEASAASFRSRQSPGTSQAMNVALLPSPKLQPRHLRLQAIVYVRQSTQRQVLENQESTRRQISSPSERDTWAGRRPRFRSSMTIWGCREPPAINALGSSAWSQQSAWARSGWCS